LLLPPTPPPGSSASLRAAVKREREKTGSVSRSEEEEEEEEEEGELERWRDGLLTLKSFLVRNLHFPVPIILSPTFVVFMFLSLH
jgi:hypothetical protein